MRTVLGESDSVVDRASKLGMDTLESKECPKNGLVNGLNYHTKCKPTKNNNCDTMDLHQTKLCADNGGTILDLYPECGENNVGKSKRKQKRRKSKLPTTDNHQLDSLNGPTLDDSELGSIQDVNNHSEESDPSCSKSEITPNCDSITSDIAKLDIKCNKETLDEHQKKIDFVPYESELQMPMIMKIIQKDLSEPYSIYTYRYFIHNWPKLCFLAMCDGQCVGAIVCKLDLHRKVVRRGYIAMLAVDQNYRKLRIGSTLVQMAIHEMTNGDADEVVLETEVTNKPALKLYEKLGFVRDKRLFRYYLNGVDALRLKLWLR